MGRNVRLDTDAVASGITQLENQSGEVAKINAKWEYSDLSNFSTVAGFRDAAAGIARITNQYSPEALNVLRDHLQDAAFVSETILNNQRRADGSWAELLSGIGLLDRYSALSGQLHSTLQVSNSRASTFTVPKPKVVGETRLLELNRKLMATRIPSAFTESADWALLAGKLTGEAAELIKVQHHFASSLETEWVQQGLERVTQIQNAAMQYAQRAMQMSMHTGTLGVVTSAESILTAATTGAYLAIPYPPAKKILEQAFLAMFHPKATMELAATVPMFTKLLPDLDHVSGNQFSVPELKQPEEPSFDHSPLPRIIREALKWAGHADLAHAMTPTDVVSQYGRPNPDMLQAISSGATATQAASAAAPTMPPTLVPGIGGGALPAGAGIGGVGSLGSLGSLGGAAGAASAGGGAFGMGAGAGRGSRNSRAGAGRTLGGGGLVAGRGRRKNDNEEQAAGKAEALTSAVEREGNLRAVLGVAPTVLPGVIGEAPRTS